MSSDIINAIEFYKIHPTLIKNQDVLLSNEIRLDKTDVGQTIAELIKNIIQYTSKNGKCVIYDKDGWVIIRNSISDNFFVDLINENITDIDLTNTVIDTKIYKKLVKLLTTFSNVRDSNFCEGLLTVCLFHAILTVSDRYFIENRKGEGTKYFQLINNSSHLPDGTNITNIPTSKRKYWEWKIEGLTANQIKSALDRDFMISSEISIYINGEKWISDRMLNRNNYEHKGYYTYESFYHNLKIAEYENDEEIVKVFFELPHESEGIRGYHKLRSTEFNKRNVYGNVILQSVNQFEGVMRDALARNTRDYIQQYIDTIVEEKQNEIEINRIIKNQYMNIKTNHLEFIEKFGIKKELYISYVFDTSISKQERLQLSTAFVKTIEMLLKYFNIPNNYGKIIEFQHSSFSMSELNADTFYDMAKQCELDFNTIFGNVLIGNLYEGGNFLGMVNLKQLTKKEYWYTTDTKMFLRVTSLPKNHYVIIILNPQFEYIINMEQFTELTEENIVTLTEKVENEIELLDSELMKKFSINYDENLQREVTEFDDEENDIETEENEEKHDSILPQTSSIHDTNVSSIIIKNECDIKNSDIITETIPDILKNIELEQSKNQIIQTNNDKSLHYEIENDFTKLEESEKSVIITEDIKEFTINNVIWKLKLKHYKRCSITEKYLIFEIGNKKIRKDTFQKFQMLRNTLSIIIEEAWFKNILPKKIPFIPVLFHQKSQNEIIIKGFRDQFGIIAMNTECIPKGNKMQKIGHVIILACHEIAHAIYDGGELHASLTEKLIDMVFCSNSEKINVSIFNLIRDSI